MSTCTTCGSTEVHANGKCRQCRNAYCRERYAKLYKGNRGEENARHRAWRKANPQKEKAIKARSYQKMRENPEKVARLNEITREQQKKARAENPEKVRAKDMLWRSRSPEVSHCMQIRYKARRKGIPFNLTKEDFIAPAVCPYLGITLIPGVGRDHVQPDAPSIDRLIPALGYVKGNVQIISVKANRIKQDATSDEVMRVALAMKAQGL
jgi:hypothetical protein